MSKPIVLSGIQPTGNLHIGNYLGAVKNWVDLQNSGKYECYFFIADYHALTGSGDAASRREQVMVLAAELMALGINPKKSTLFVQSHIVEHTELAWIFSTITPVAELERMTQFKDKAARQDANVNTGLLTYPTLMAADILLYHANFVPVGQDQTQHMELTNDMVRWFNNRYGNYFTPPKLLLTDVPKAMSLLEPTKKMSKSLGAAHVIELADEPEVITNKLKKAVTATEGGGDAPGVANLFLLLKQFGSEQAHADFEAQEKAGTIRYGDLKTAVGDAVTLMFADFRRTRADLIKHPNKIAKELAVGAKRAKKIAEKTMIDVRKLVGIR